MLDLKKYNHISIMLIKLKHVLEKDHTTGQIGSVFIAM